MASSNRGLVLGIETSCDDTCAAVVAGGVGVLSSVVASQDELHVKFGGVVPEHASRRHVEVALPAIEQSLADAGVGPRDLSALAVTAGPGLVGSLLVGLSTAKALAMSWRTPLVAVNHVEAHAYATFLGRPAVPLPHLCLTVSGGHTNLMLVRSPLRMELVGSTLDDSAGEAFDKVASFLGFGYPGGPALEARAAKGDASAFQLPRPVIDSHGHDFSFSGLKTAVLTRARDCADGQRHGWREDLAAAFQCATVDVLVHKTVAAARELGIAVVSLSGGVASNRSLRLAMSRRAAAEGLELLLASPEYCTDNAAMVAGLGWQLFRAGALADVGLDAEPGWRPGVHPP
jgi:N6-L-threonylcarbamoyladenine synthase